MVAQSKSNNCIPLVICPPKGFSIHHHSTRILLQLLSRLGQLFFMKGPEDHGKAALLFGQLDLSRSWAPTWGDGILSRYKHRIFKKKITWETPTMAIYIIIHMYIYICMYVYIYYVCSHMDLVRKSLWSLWSTRIPCQQVPKGRKDLMPPEAHDVLRLVLRGCGESC